MSESTGSTGVDADSGNALTTYLQQQATAFLRALRLHRESGGVGSGAEESAQAARDLRHAARRIGGTLHTFRPLLDPEWADALRAELAWLSGTLGHEHASAARLERLLAALHRLSGAVLLPGPRDPESAGTGSVAGPAGPVGVGRAGRAGRGGGDGGAGDDGAAGRAGGAGGAQSGSVPSGSVASGSVPPQRGGDDGVARSAGSRRSGSGAPGAPGTPGASGAGAPSAGSLTIGAAKAGALLERQLTLVRTRAHSTALQALGSSRFHAVADRVAVLASEVPLAPGAPATDLKALAAQAEERLAEAVAALPLCRAGRPYNAEALMYGLAAEPVPQSQDAPWHQVRLLLRLHRYAREVLYGTYGTYEQATEASAVVRDANARDGRGGQRGRAPRERAQERVPAERAQRAGAPPCTDPVDLRLAKAGLALDRHRDASEAAAAAAAAARTPRIAPSTAYALGVLHADQRHEVEAARFAFQDVWLQEAVSPR